MEQFIKALTNEELTFLSEWISLSKELPLISSEKNTFLSKELLNHWLETSISCIVLRGSHSEIFGFATLTQQEAQLPISTAEICHLIIHPNLRRQYNGSSLVLKLMQFGVQNKLGAIYGRAVPTNQPGIKLLQYLNWIPVPDKISNTFDRHSKCVWYQKNLEKNEERIRRNSATIQIGA